MQQGRDAHPIPVAMLNTGWVQEGDGAERRRGAEPEKHHSGLHFITMATSWKPYRIRAPEHQIREAAAGRMLAPCGWTGSPGAWGWGEHGAWWHFSPSCLPPSFHRRHLVAPGRSTRKRLKFTFAKPSSMWDLLPDGCCAVSGTQEQPAKAEASFLCLSNHADAGGWSREGERMLRRKSAPNPPL